MDNDVTILYQGGSGGFLIYFLMLLSGNYRSGDTVILNHPDPVEATRLRIKTQFPKHLVTHRTEWKVNEVWPNNNKLKSINIDRNKLFLICNPLFNDELRNEFLSITDSTFKILLYTDLDIQLRMAFEKNAYWFTHISKMKFNVSEDISNIDYIRKIKSEFVISDTGKNIDPTIPEIIKLFKPNIVINLVDILKNRENYNADQNLFIDHWLSLQSSKTLKLLNI